MKNIIIDGYNLAHKHAEISAWLKKGDTDKTIHLLINWLIRGPVSKGNKIILVLDGKKGYFKEQTYSSSIKLIFSQKPQTADDIIRNYIRNASNPAELTIVSSDNEIIFTAKDHGAKAIKSEVFLKQYVKKTVLKKNRTSVSNEKYNPENIDVDYWLKQFGDDNS
jgi:predicted RNA-binding protein with PIN domain